MRPRLQLLDRALIDGVVDDAVSILERTGVQVDDESAFRLLCDLGLRGDPAGMRVTFTPAQIEEAIEQAPSSITLYDRDGEPHATLEGDRVHFVPGSTALNILDHETEEVRLPTSDDFVTYARVADGLDHIAYLATAFVPADVPDDVADAWRLYLCLASSKKPVVSGAFTPDGIERLAGVLDHFRADRDRLAGRPLAVMTVCPNTPLRWGTDPMQNLIDCARLGIPVEVIPMLLIGMISPSTIVGSLVLHTAEVLSGLTIAQRIRPGTPVLFGGAPAGFHMRLMTSPLSAIEALRLSCGYAQIAKRLQLPCQTYMGLSDSKFNDPQAGAESGVGAILAALAGFNSVSGPGMLAFVNCFSLEKLVFDDELAAQALRFVREVEVRDDLPAGPLVDELVDVGHMMVSPHTRAHWREELYLPGEMIDRTDHDQWRQQGERRSRDRALSLIADKLARHVVPPLGNDVHRSIREFLSGAGAHAGVALPDPFEQS